jgi:hypothetical protein
MRGADGDESIESLRIPFGESQRHHTAVRRADDGVETVDARRVEHRGDGICLIVRGNEALGASVGAAPAVEEVDAEDAMRIGVEGACRTGDPVPPSATDMAIRRNTAERENDRRAHWSGDLEVDCCCCTRK